MKFICDKCKTKYSIADTKVKGKVLKIRCKNCSNIITVREQRRASPSGTMKRAKDTGSQARGGGALGRAFDGAFKETQQVTTGMLAAAPDISPDPGPTPGPLSSEPTRLSDAPDFLDDQEPGDDEWYLAVDGNQYGPMGFGELCNRIKRGEAGSEAFCWRDGFDDWKDIGEVPELQSYIPRHPPPPPKGKSGLIALTPGALSDPDVADGTAPSVDQLAGEASRPAPILATATPAPAPTPVAPARPKPRPVPQQGQITADPDLLATVPSAEADKESRPIMPVAPLRQAPPAATGTPMLMKVTAVGGIVAAVSGIILVVYFLLLDRAPPEPAPVTKVAALEPAKERAAPAKPDPAAPAEEGAMDIEFDPEVVAHSKAKARPARTKARPKATGVAKPSGPAMSAEQRRMMAMAKNFRRKALPGVSARKRANVNARTISSADIQAVQRKFKNSLKACFERAAKRDNKMGTVKVNFTIDIGDTGIVRSVSIEAGGNRELQVCLTRVSRRMSFPAIGAQSFSFNILFKGSG